MTWAPPLVLAFENRITTFYYGYPKIALHGRVRFRRGDIQRTPWERASPAKPGPCSGPGWELTLKGKTLVALTVTALLVLLGLVTVLQAPVRATSASFGLYTMTSGWGLSATSVTSPGPTLTVTQGDLVQLSLTGVDNAWHDFFVDYNGNGVPDPSLGEPLSPDFKTQTISYSFTADLAGTFTYACKYHFKNAYGTFVVNPAPAANTAPRGTISAPSGGSSWTGGSQHSIWWNFSDSQDAASALVSYLNYSSSAGRGTIAGPLSGHADPQSFSWTVPLIDSTDVVVNLTVIDTGGLHGWDQKPVPKIDSTPPTVTGVSPLNGAVGVDPNTTLAATFSEPMNLAATDSALSLMDVGSGAPVSITVLGWSSTTVIFEPSALLQNDTLYKATVGTGTRDDSDPGNALVTAYSWTFWMLNNPPSGSVLAPSAGVSWTGGSSHDIAWVVSDLEDPVQSLNVTLNYSTTGAAPWARMAGPLSGNASPLLWTVPLVNTTSARINLTVTDISGLSTSAISAAFEIDSTPPVVTSVFPSDGNVTVVRNTQVRVSWSEGMDVTATATPATLGLQDQGTGQWVSGKYSWNTQQDTIVLTPDAPLAPNTLYWVYVNTSAKDESDPGNALASSFRSSFTTTGWLDTQAPSIRNVTASPSPQNVGLAVTIQVDAVDNISVGDVWVNVTGPSGGTLMNFTLTFAGVTLWTGDVFSQEVGIHTVVVWVSDTSGNWNVSSSSFDMIDTIPPSISSLVANPSTAYVPTLARISAVVTDNVAVAGVWVEVATSNLTAVFDAASGVYAANLTVSAVGTYSYVVWARDTSGLWASANGSFLALDTQAPRLVSVSVVPGLQELGLSTQVSVTASDNTGVTRVSIDIPDVGNLTLNQSVPGDPYVVSLLVAQPGTYPFVAWVADASNNWASFSSQFEVVDTTPPTPSHTPVTVWPRAVPIPINVSAMDLGGVAGVWVQFKGTNLRTLNVSAAVDGGSNYTVILPAQNLTGNLTYFIAAVDASGNWVLSPTYTVAIQPDIIPPPQEDLSLVYGVLTILAVIGVANLILAVALARFRRRLPSENAANGGTVRSDSPGTLGLHLKLALVAILAASALSGVYLVWTDSHLWDTAPDHAMVLLGFVAMDAGLIGFLFLRDRLGSRLTSLWGAGQFVLMIADVGTAPQYGLTYAQFANYLFGLPSFVALLALQAVLSVVGYHTIKVLRRSREPRNPSGPLG